MIGQTQIGYRSGDVSLPDSHEIPATDHEIAASESMAANEDLPSPASDFNSYDLADASGQGSGSENNLDLPWEDLDFGLDKHGSHHGESVAHV